MSIGFSRKTLVATLRTKLRAEQRESLYTQYQKKPDLWIEQRAKGFMWSVPRKIAQSVVEHRRTAVPSAHDVGKSWLSARLAAWWIDTRLPGTAFVITTAPTAKQVKSILWKELHRVYVTANLQGRMNQTEWWVNNEMIAMGRKPSNYDPTAFQGIHAREVLLILDEACGVPEQIYLAGNSLIANAFGRILAIGNPDDPDSHFAKVCAPGSGWNVINVSAFDTPNFTGEPCPQEVKDVLVSSIYVDEMKHDIGEDSPVYISKVLGQFPENNTDGMIPLSFIRRCQDEDEYDNRTDDDCFPVEIGIDFGAGGDETSARVRYGKFVGSFVEAKTPTALEAFDLIVPFIMEHHPTRIKIDIIGIGWAMLGLLQQAIIRSRVSTLEDGSSGYIDERTGAYINLSFLAVDSIVPVNVGMAATDPERFVRLRSQMWWEIGRLLSQDRGWNLFGLDEITVGQLTRLTYKVDSANRIVAEQKADMMKRTKQPSPNRADALLMAFCEPPRGDLEAVMVYHDPITIEPDI